MTAVVVLATVAAFATPFAERASAAIQNENSGTATTAGGSVLSKPLDQQVLSWASYNGVRRCIVAEQYNQSGDDGWGGHYINESDAKSGHWWRDASQENPIVAQHKAERSGSYLNPSVQTSDRGGNGKTLCDDILKTGLALWGYSSAFDLLCDAGVTRADGGSCREGTDRFGNIHDFEPKIAEAIRKKAYGGQNPQLSDAGKYLLYKSVFDKGCQAQLSQSAAEDKFVFAIQIVGDDRAVQHVRYVTGRDKDTGREINVSDTLDDVTKNCGEIAGVVDQTADAYAKYLKAHPNEQVGGSSTQNQTCSDGSTPAADGKCPDGSTITPPSGDAAGSSCAVPDVGWMVCPAVNFLTNVADNMYAFLAGNFLEVQSGLFKDEGTYSAWRAMQAIANVAFVIGFMIIVFSHLSSVGVNNYGIKKLLPRLIIAAVLVNVSYIVCQLAIDISNLFGYGLRSLFTNVIQIPDVVKYGDDAAKGTGAFGLAGAATTILAAGAGIYLALPFLGGAALVVVVVLLTIGFLLIARKSILVLLVVIAPLAFVAYLLPNTEQWFTKWRKMFVGLLLVFPIIGMLFGAGNLASRVLMTAAGDDKLLQITAALAAVIPLVFVWGVLKGSLNAAGAIGSKINGMSGKLQGKANAAGRKGWDNSRFGQSRAMRKQRRATNRALAQAGAYSGRNPLRKLQSATNRAYNNSALSGRSGNLLAARGVALAGKEEDEELGAEVARQSAGVDPRDMIDVASRNLRQAAEKGDVVAARAAQKILLSSGARGLEALHSTLEGSEAAGKLNGEVSRKIRSDIQAANLKGKDNGLDVWARSNATLSQAGSAAGTYSGLTPTELAGQTAENLARAEAAGGVTASQARATLDNESAASALSTEKRDILERIAGSPAAAGLPATPASIESAAPSQGLSVPHGSATESAAGSVSSPVDENFRQGVADAVSGVTASSGRRPAPPAAPASPRAPGATDAERDYYSGDDRRD